MDFMEKNTAVYIYYPQVNGVPADRYGVVFGYFIDGIPDTADLGGNENGNYASGRIADGSDLVGDGKGADNTLNRF